MTTTWQIGLAAWTRLWMMIFQHIIDEVIQAIPNTFLEFSTLRASRRGVAMSMPRRRQVHLYSSPSSSCALLVFLWCRLAVVVHKL